MEESVGCFGGEKVWVSFVYSFLLMHLDASLVRSMCTSIAQATTGLFSKNHLKQDVTEFLK